MLQSTIDYFPLAIASGSAFCNRLKEIDTLLSSFAYQRPIVITSPRRYGKTSLVLKAINKSKVPYANIDFFSIVDEQDIEKIILQGIGELIYHMESKHKKALQLAVDFFSGTHIKVSTGRTEFSLEISRRKEKPAYHILDILKRLEALASKKKQPIILFFDEFQCLSEVSTSHAIEAVLRQVVQSTKYISFVFSGSNRHLLNQMFSDKKRPFYKLCERMELGRIEQLAYQKHLNKLLIKTLGMPVPENVLALLFSYTKQHPYYMNLLCSRIFLKQMPSTQFIEKTWHQYILEQRSTVAAEMDLLSANQRKLLRVLARHPGVTQPLGQKFIHIANMSKASIAQALKFLDRKDYIYKNEQEVLCILDPLLEAVLTSD